ncbi:MAG: ATP-binding cassette domain-containing protein [Rhodobacteraceae bacterium]|nr:ATP-binding cassette domain-containing protein [Paracoccaceae bacterium]
MTRRDFDTTIGQAIRQQRKDVRLAIVAASCAAAASVFLMGLSGWFITGAAFAGLAGLAAVQSFNYLLPSAAIRLLAIIRTVSRYGERLYSHRAALNALAAIRARIFDQILRVRDVRAVSAGDAVSRLIHDIAALEDNLVRQPSLPAAVIAGIVGIGLTLFAGPWAASALFVILCAIPLLIRNVTPRLLGDSAIRVAELHGALKAAAVDYAAASPEIVAYQFVNPLREALESQAAALDSARVAYARAESTIGAGLTAASGLAVAAVFGLTQSGPVETILAAFAAASAVDAFGGFARSLSRDSVVAESILRLESLMKVGAPNADLPANELGEVGTIEISFGGAPATLVKGTRAAIVGRSGCGKSSLLEVLAGYRPAERTKLVSINGHSLSDYHPFQLRQSFALSPQDAQLISGTIRDNLRVARPGVTDDDAWEAMEIACIAADVRALPDKLDAWVGDGGNRLSGGQRKRLSLARALLAGRPWLLLDEPTEGLDSDSELRLIAKLEQWLDHTGTGLIVATHRPALLALAKTRLDLDRQRIFANAAAEPRARD